MVDNNNPKNWTRQYVRSHRSECLLLLRELNVGAINYIEERRYWTAGVHIDLLMDGFDVLLKSEKSDKIRSCIAAYSCAVAELCALVDPATYENELRNMGIRPDFQGKSAARYLRDVAIMGFEDAQDYARSRELRNSAVLMARVLKAGTPAECIRRDYAPDFPKDVQDILLKLDDDFFVPEIRQCAPDRCFVLDKSRLLFTRKIVGERSSYTPSGSYTPAGFGPVEMPADISGKMSMRSRPDNDFDVWMEENGWDEEDLEWAYKRVKLRRNIYGILSFTPLGLILFPFWLRSMYLTKAIKNRNSSVKLNIIAWIICAMYTVCTFFVYAAVMIWIIKRTNWGMGLGDRRALIPTFAVVALFAFLIFQANIKLFPDIGRLIKATSTTSVSGTKQEEPPAALASVLTDQDLLELASERLNNGVEICIANADFLEADENDYITATDKWGYDNTFYRVIGYDTIAEVEEAAMELWYGTYSRRLTFSISSHSMDMMRDQLMEHNGELYRQYLGVGDGGACRILCEELSCD